MSLVPRLSSAEWVTYCLLAAVLAVVNVYATLLTGWAAGGSIIAVLGSMLALGVIGRRPSRDSLNLGQTIASAGATIGFAASAYAAVRMAAPDFEASPPLLLAMFAGLAAVATLLAASVRRAMVRHHYPSGTACAVIQRTVLEDGDAARRPVRLLALWGAISGAITIPTKIALSKGGPALLGSVPLGTLRGAPIAIATDPLLIGIGVIAGPRVGVGLLIGGLLAPTVIAPTLLDSGVGPAAIGDWLTWLALSALTAPTFAAMAFGRMFRAPHHAPPGFHPRDAGTRIPARAYGALAVLGVGLGFVATTAAFDMPWYVAAGGIALSMPLAVMNARVMADTDVNPVFLSVILLMSVCAWTTSPAAAVLTGLAIVVSIVAGISGDLLQDYRTGYLLGANASHQTAVQLVGAAVGVAVAVPLVLVLDAAVGFGASGLPSPGPRIYAVMASGLAGGASAHDGLTVTIAVVSLAGSAYAFLCAWPRTRAWMPSIFGMGMGLLLPFEMSAAICLGALIRAAITGLRPQLAEDTTLAGSAAFASSALVGVVVVLITLAMERAGLTWFFMAPLG